MYTRKRKQQFGKRTLAVFLAAVLTASMVVAVSPPASAADGTYSGTQNTIVLNSGYYVFNNLNITGGTDTSAVDITYGANVTIELQGTSTLRGGNGSGATPGAAGIIIRENATLTITGAGTLNAYGGAAGNGGGGGGSSSNGGGSSGIGGGGAGAGIGGSGGNGGQSINVNVGAGSSGPGGAGRSGGPGGLAGSIMIISGTVNAYGGSGGSNGGNGGSGGGGGGSGYPAAGIGGGGAGGGSGGYRYDGSNAYSYCGGGGGGYSGGGGSGGSYSGGNSGNGGAGIGHFITGGAGGGGYLSKGGEGGYTIGGAIGGSGGGSQGGNGGNGGSGGDLKSITIYPTATVRATNGNNITFNRGANHSSAYGGGIGSGAGYTEPASPAIVSVTIPAVPTGLTATAGNAQVSLSWTASNGNGATVTAYEVFRNGASLGTTAGTSYTDSGLTNGTSYSYTVRAQNSIGWSAQCGAVSATPDVVPPAPQNVKAVGGKGTLALTWSAPTAGNYSGITGYNVYLDNVKNNASPLTGGSYTATGLVSGKSYSVQVAAINAKGEGAKSSAISGVPQTTPTMGALTFTEGNAQVSLSWTADNGGAAITAFEVFQNGVSLGTTTASNYVSKDLQNGQTYTYTVRAQNVEGWSAQTAAVSATPNVEPPAPRELRVNCEDKALSLFWEAPPTGNYGVITGYNVYLNGVKHNSAPVTDLTYRISGLTNGSTYNLTLAAVNAKGESAHTGVVTAIPAAIPSAPRNVQTEIGNGTLLVLWDAPSSDGGSKLAGYEVYLNDGKEDKLAATTTVTNATLTGLVNGAKYDVTVQAKNAKGSGEPSSAISVRVGAPLTPQGFAVTPKNGGCAVRFDPAVDNGSRILKYRIYVDGAWYMDTTATSLTIPNLENGMGYRVAVSAVNDVAESPKTAEITVVCGAPTTPENVRLTGGANSINLTWSASVNNGNRMLGYKIYVKSAEGETAYHAASTATSTTISDLKQGVAYTVTMTAENIAGESGRTAPQTITLGSPDAPTITEAISGENRITLIWDAPANEGGSAVTGYRVYVDGVLKTTTAIEMAELTNLVNGRAYTIAVSAVNAQGEGPVDTRAGLIPCTGATAPLNPAAATIGVDSARVTWKTPASDGGSAITGYELTYDGLATPISVPLSANNSYDVKGLERAKTYVFSICAVTAAGTGLSANTSAVTMWDLPDAPTIASVQPTNGGLTVTFGGAKDSSAKPLGYTVYVNGFAKNSSLITSGSYTVTGLTNGEYYDVQATCTNAVGESAKSEVFTAIPGVPTAPVITSAAPANGGVTLTWTPATANGKPVINYQIYVNGVVKKNVSAATTSTGLTGLTNGSTVKIKLSALSENGYSQDSNTVEVIVGAPLAPTLVSATAGENKIDLTWTAPTANAGAITGYQIYVNGEKGNLVTGTTATLTGLTPGTEYTVAVSAINSAGEGAPSNTMAATPWAKPGAPEITSIIPGDGSFTLTWSSADGRGKPITGYEIWVDGVKKASAAASITSKTISGIANGTPCVVKVCGVNIAGAGDFSAAESITVGVPSTPEITDHIPGDGQVELSWTPSLPNGTMLKGYYVYVDGQARPITTATRMVVDGLTNGQDVTLTVRAENIAGLSAGSQPLTTRAGTTSEPTITKLTEGDRSVTLTWEKPVKNGDSVEKYIIYDKDSGAKLKETTELSTQVGALDNGREYGFVVTAVNSIGESRPSNEKRGTPYTVPNRPLNVTAAPVSGSEVSLTWIAPLDDGGKPIEVYDILLDGKVIGSYPPVTTFSEGGTEALSANVDDLESGKSYTFQVAAVNLAGTGEPAEANTVTTPVVCSAPTLVYVEPASGKLTAEWTAPADGDSTTTYNIYVDGVKKNTAPIEGLTYEITGLTNGVKYGIQATAENAVGESAKSNTIYGKPAGNFTVIAPGAPTGLTVTPGDKSLSLSWTAPGENGGEAVDGYYVYLDGNQYGTLQAGLTREVTGLVNGVTYQVSVAAHNSAGTGTKSTAVPATPEIPPALNTPGKPTGVSYTVNPGKTAATIRWTAPTSDGGSAITGYNIYQAGTATPLNPAPLTQLSFEMAVVNDGTAYTVGVKAANAQGEGALSTNIRVLANINIDTNGDGKADVNVDVDGDGKADLNIDTDGDGDADLNIDVDGDGDADLNIDTDGDGKADLNVDTDGDGKADVNVDTDGDGTPDINIDLNGDGNPDVNVDTDGDGTPDINIDADGDGKPDVNVDLDGDGTPDINVDKNGDGYPDTDIDLDGDGVPDMNPSDGSGGSVPGVTVPKAPDVPQGVTAVSNGTDTIKISWAEPADNGSPITGYTVYIGSSNYTANGTEYEFTADASTYPIRVSAHNAVGESGLSATVLASLGINVDTSGDGVADDALDGNGDGLPDSTTDANPPYAPQDLKAISDNKTAINLTWTAPENDGGSAITGYSVYDGDTKLGDAADTGFTFTPTAGQTYHLTVAAVNAAGEGGRSATAIAKMDLNIDTDGDGNADLNVDMNGDGKPDINIDTDGDGTPDINIDKDGDGNPNINVDVDGDGNADVNVDVDGDGNPDVNIDVDGDGNPDFNLDMDGDGKIDKPGSIPGADVEGVPYPPVVTGYLSQNDGSIVVSWKAPAQTGGSAITGYTVYVNGVGTTLGNVLTHTFPATANTLYTITVSAVNGKGEGGRAAAIKAKNHLNLDSDDDGAADANLDANFDGVSDAGASESKVKIKGTVELMNNMLNATITVYDENGVVVTTASVGNGAFEIELNKPTTPGVAYSLKVSKQYGLKLEVQNIVLGDTDVTIAETLKVYAGDLDNDNTITAADVNALNNQKNTAVPMLDLDNDGKITAADVNMLAALRGRTGQIIIQK